MKSITITANDGYQLSALYATPIGESIGTIILSSATGVKKEFYLHFAQYLTQNGYNILLFDYRGIGGSATANIKTAKSYMHEWGTKDMNAALDYLVYEKKLTNIIWVGHSVGAQLIGFLENKQHIKKVVAISAALGYWGYFPFPMNLKVWTMWYIIGPYLIKKNGYGTMRKIGWGEDLPKNIILEWRKWCISKNYFGAYLQEQINADKFYEFTTPITAIYLSDDYIANDKTASMMMQFFPNSEVDMLKINVKEHTKYKVGHTGIFKPKFRDNLWGVLAEVIEK